MGKGGSKISTKSGFERREENRKRGAIEGSKRRMLQGENVVHGDMGAVAGEAGEWSGFDD
jgi:ATP-dependent RNA helicase DDX52/ROK1